VPPNLWPKIYNLWKGGGQGTDPADFKWILASSPRVEDLPKTCVPCRWNTELVLTMGPGDKTFVGLDITNPSNCSATTCTLNSPAFLIKRHSRDLATLTNYLGETWSVPVLFYSQPTSSVSPGQMAMGSGYGTGDQGKYYNFFGVLYAGTTATLGNHATRLHDSGGAQVDYGLITDTVAAIDFDRSRDIIATYQGDLKGRIYRYDRGVASSRQIVLNAGTSNPIYFSPAVYHKGNHQVLFAAASGSQDEVTPPSNAVSTLYIRSERNGVVDTTNDFMSCRVSDICSGGALCPDAIPLSCSAPSSRARPVGPPVIIKNQLGTNSYQYEIFWVYYDPPRTTCQMGTSWVIRVSTSGTTQTLISATQYASTRATGISIIGGGLDVAITTVGTGGNAAGITPLTNNINQGSLTGTAPYIETWKEVK